MDEPGAAAWWVAFVNRLPRYKFLLRKRWWILLLTVAIGFLLSAWRALMQPMVYSSSAKLVVSGKWSLQENASYNEESSAFLGTQIEWMRGDEVLRRANERVQALQPGIQQSPVHIDASVLPRTTIFLLTASGSNPEYTQKYLQACVDEYMDERREMRAEKSQTTLTGLTDQLAKLDREIQDSDDELLAFQKQNNVGFLQEESASAASYLVKQNQQLADLKTEYQLLDLLNLDQTLDRQQKPSKPSDNSNAPVTDDSSKNPTGAEADYLKARQEIQVLKAKRDDMAKIFRPKHPDMIEINQQIDHQETLIAAFRNQSIEQLKSRRESLAVQIKNLETTIAQWESKALELNQKMAEYNRIKSKGARAKASYDLLFSNSRSVDLNNKVDQEVVSVMSQATPAVSIRPGLWKMISLGLTGGFFAGLAILFVLDKIDDRMNSFGEFQAHFDEDVLAKIPDEPKAENPLSYTTGDERVAFLESMRALRSSIFYLPVDGKPPKTFLVTSAVPNEGKTTVATNLAITMSYAGSKVLLIDGDLRRGTIHEKFGLDNSVGIGDVFKGTATVEKAARKTRVENLSLMARGANLEHPGESYLGKKADDLLKALYPLYDVIIFDSSPVLVADDTTSLAPKIDAAIFVVRFSFSSARRSREAIDLLKKRQVNLIGLVCNGVNQWMKDYYYNKYPEYYAVKHDV